VKTLASLWVLLALPALLWAGSAETMIENLVAQAWAPTAVRVEWKFSGKPPLALAETGDWKLVDPTPERISGSVILLLERMDQTGNARRIAVSGTASIFGPSVTAKKEIGAGQPVIAADLVQTEMDWTHLNGVAASMDDFSRPVIAAHALVPGRCILTRDIQPKPLVRNGQTVELQFVDGAVKVRISGRATQDGAVGDVIPVLVDLGKTHQLKGTVNPDGTLQLVR
jgi:flagella basal body P-ring formation protein FlgA